MAATDKFVVTVRGKGGHGGQPEKIKDAILAASMTVVALQPLISREISPTDSAILGITRFNTGKEHRLLFLRRDKENIQSSIACLERQLRWLSLINRNVPW